MTLVELKARAREAAKPKGEEGKPKSKPGVRYVRTAEGAKRYGKPIGSIISSDGKEIEGVQIVGKTDDGKNIVTGKNKKRYVFWKQPGTGRWYFALESSPTKVINTAGSEEEVLARISGRAKANARDARDDGVINNSQSPNSDVELPTTAKGREVGVLRDMLERDETSDNRRALRALDAMESGTRLTDTQIRRLLDRIGEQIEKTKEGMQSVPKMQRRYALRDLRTRLEATIGRRELNRSERLGSKAVRHVRTPEGAAYYGQPIGSVIIADAPDLPSFARTSGFRITPSPVPRGVGSFQPSLDGFTHLWGEEPEYEGYDTVTDGRRRKYHVYEENGSWHVIDDEDYSVVEGASTLEGALQELEKQSAPIIPKGMRLATPEERKEYRIPPDWRDVVIWDAAERKKRGDKGSFIARGRDAAGRGQYLYTEARAQKSDKTKFSKMKKLQKVIGKLDEYLSKNAGKGDDNVDALMMMRVLGMRPDTEGKGGSVETFGATSLQAKHVKVSPTGLVTLNFTPGKKKEPVTIKIKDPALADMLRGRLEKYSRNDRIFPTAKSDRVNQLLRGVVGEEFTNKDLRTLRANAIALASIRRYKNVPKTKTEFRRMRREVATAVSDVLGNTPTIALNSYIDPSVFAKWLSDPDWA